MIITALRSFFWAIMALGAIFITAFEKRGEVAGQITSGQLFDVLRNASGEDLCCMNAPIAILKVQNAAECAMRCAGSSIGCAHFNVKTNGGVRSCELYGSELACYGEMTACTHYWSISQADQNQSSESLGPNLALHKPAWQSSFYGSNASAAVDGNTDDNDFHGSCACTKKQTWPWWAVDLGTVTNVKSVTITNRGDCCATRLSDFTVGLTDVSPLIAAPGPGLNGTGVCLYHPGSVPSGNSSYVCDPCTNQPGRYLYVTMPGPNFLTLCEVEVFGITDFPAR